MPRTIPSPAGLRPTHVDLAGGRGVVITNGTLYAAAGIAHYDGTHVYALDAVTGRIKWYNGPSGRLCRKFNSGARLATALRNGGLIRFEGEKRTGCWRPV